MKRKEIVESILTVKKSKEEKLTGTTLRHVSNETLDYLEEQVVGRGEEVFYISDLPEPFKTNYFESMERAAKELGITQKRFKAIVREFQKR